MRMLVDVEFPHEAFNKAVRDGTVGATISRILEEIKAEAVYFTERNGRRGATLIVDIKDPSDVPSIAEPFFLSFNADCHFRIVMTPEDLQSAGLDELGDKWG